MQDVGLVGVGFIGKLFVDRLTGAGYRLTVYDVDDSQVAYAVDRGADGASSPAAVARAADVVLLAVPGSPEVEATLEGDDSTEAAGAAEDGTEAAGAAEDGLLAALEDGDLVIDASTTHPDTSVVSEELCEAAGAGFLEAPITGGAPRDGYHVMVGGTEANYEAARDVLDVICADHVRVGPVPEATVLKLGLQMRYAGRHAVDAEVVEFLRDNGVDPELLVDFFGFDVLEGYFTGDYTQDIEGLGGLAIWNKDVGYAREYAHSQHTALPLAGVVQEAYKAAVRRAGPDGTDAAETAEDGTEAAEAAEDEGHAAALIRYWQALNDAEERTD